MKRLTARRSRVVVPLLVLTLVLVGAVALTASAGTRHAAAPPAPACSIAGVAGAWGDNFDGTSQNGALATFAGAGRNVVDGQGTVSGTETSSQAFGGNGGTAVTMTGTVSVNPDCTGTLTLSNQQSNTVIRTEVWAVVYVDNETAMRATLTSLTYNTFNVSNISATLNADKLFPPTGGPGS